MQTKTFTFTDGAGVEIFVRQWVPDSPPIHAVVQIAHGMAETSERYQRFAKALTEAGYVVYANDHRGHGETAGILEEVGCLGEDGYNWMIRNLHQLNGIIQQQYPGVPIFLFGHSMGSFLAQQYIALYGHSIQGVILSGTGGKPGPLLHFGIHLAKREMKKNGPRSRSQTLTDLTFGAYNKTFQPARTPFDWLSRDESEVDLYVENPYCGGVFTANFYYYFFKGLQETHQKGLMQQIRKNLPIHIIFGNQDPVGRNGKGVMQLLKMYRNLDLQQVTHQMYPGGRHEMLNETNRDEVTHDILAWLTRHHSSLIQG
jgi:alpha-beta hydrolase superfamily lysophospholipase